MSIKSVEPARKPNVSDAASALPPLLASGISAVGLGLALDGLQMLVLPYMTHPLL